MGRSLLQKHTKATNPPDKTPPKLAVIPGGKSERPSELLTDADWYHIHGFWKSSLFNEQYLRDDFQRIRSGDLQEYEVGFQAFLNQFLNLCDHKRNEKFHTWNEDQTVRSWIMPVMETLGWWDSVTDPVIPELTFTVSDGERKRTYRPDCVFVPTQNLKGTIQEKDPSERVQIARRYISLTLEAKYWDRLRKFDVQDNEIGTKVDITKTRSSDSASSLSPGGQILAYLKHLKNDDPPRNHFGVVTDGKVWRLHHVDRPEDKYFEFDLGELFFEITSGKAITDLKGKQYRHIEEAARYFYYIFSNACLYSKKNEPTLVDDLFEYSKKYVEKAEQDLKDRFLTAMKYACNGFHRAFKENGIEVDLDTIRDVSESHIFNILFLKSCEAKGIIRYEANTDISITSIIERISHFEPGEHFDESTNESVNLIPAFRDFEFRNTGVELHNRILKLTDIVQNGGRLESGLEISAFKESLFSKNERDFICRCKLKNIETVKLLYALGYMEEDGQFRQIPYNIFTPEQLGSIYESFLEFRLQESDEDLEFINNQWVSLTKKTSDKLKRGELVKHSIARKNELFFTPNNADRRASGSYYTPDPVVKFIVEDTLAPLCKGINAKEILNIKICDPAMGSGHFLVGALRFIASQYIEALENESISQYKPLPQVKRDILDSCIYGVDINPQAIRLAKMALWLETAHSGAKLECLDDQLKCADSINERKLWSKEWLFGGNRFSAVIGNPPFVSYYSRHSSKKGKSYLNRTIELSKEDDFFEIVSAKGDKGRYNLSMFFFELAFKIVNPKNGRIGLIGDIGFEEDAYIELRRLIIRDKTITKYFRKINAFKDVNSEQIILFGVNSKSLCDYHIPCIERDLTSKEKTIRIAPDQSTILWEQLDVKSAAFFCLGEIFDVSTGVNIGGASETFLAESKQNSNYYPFISAGDFDRFERIKKTSITTFINFSDTLVEKINKQSKASGSSNVVVLGDIDRFSKPKLFLRQSSKVLTCTYETGEIVSSYSVFVINHKEDTYLRLLELLFHTKYYNKLSWDMGIAKGGEGKQPQMRKGSLNSNKVGVVSFPLPKILFQGEVPRFAAEWISEFSKVKDLKDKEMIVSKVEKWLKSFSNENVKGS